MIEYIKRLFRPSVDKVIGGIQKKVDQLEALIKHHGAQCDAHTAAAVLHAGQQNRAANIAGKFKDLIS